MRNNIKENTIRKAETKESFLSALQSLTKTQKKILNHFISLRSVFKHIFPSQTTIALAIDSGRTWVLECIKVLESLGFISTKYYHRTSKSYKISPLFHNPFYRSIAMAVLPALVSLPLYSILSSQFQKTDTITYRNLFKDFSYSSYTKNSTSDELILKNRETKRVEELKKERLTTNVHKIFYDETYPGDVYVSKYHKREVSVSMASEAAKSQPQSTKKLFPNALLGRAKDILEKAQKGKITRFRAKRDLKICRDAFPEGIPIFTEWYNSSEGFPLKKWLSEQD
jgi:hypothetical protein